MWFCSDWYLYFWFRYSDQGNSRVEEMRSHHISTKRMKLEKSSSFVNPFEYVHFDIFYIMFICNIVNIVQHSHLYNSFLLIIVACIMILLVAILYRDHVGFYVIVTFSSNHKLKWPVLLSYLREWNQTGTELTHVWIIYFWLIKELL